MWLFSHKHYNCAFIFFATWTKISFASVKEKKVSYLVRWRSKCDELRRIENDLTLSLSLQLLYKIYYSFCDFTFSYEVNLLIMYVAVDHFRVSQFNRLEVYVFDSRIAHQFIQVRPWLKLFCFRRSAGFFSIFCRLHVECVCVHTFINVKNEQRKRSIQNNDKAMGISFRHSR